MFFRACPCRRVVGVIALLLLWSEVRGAEVTRFAFDLPAAEARPSLRRFAAQAGRDIIFPVESVDGITTNAVKGEMTPREALDKMLAATGLTASQDDRTGAFAIKRESRARQPPPAKRAAPSESAPNPTPVQPMKRSLPARLTAAFAALTASALTAQTAVPPPAASKTDETITLSVFTVTSEKDLGYESMQTTAGMRTVQDLRNVANSISIVNARLIEDLAVVTVGEMSRWFLTGEESPDPAAANQLIFRGILTTFPIRNGWIWYSPMDSYATERVELLRGPNAFLYGEAELGGSLNQITKRGLFTRDLTRTKLMVGSDALRRVELDLNRRLNDKVAVRLAAVQSNNDSWIDYVRRDFRAIYGAITIRPFPTTTISVMGEHAKRTSVDQQGLFRDGFSYTGTATLNNGAGVIYVPATGGFYRAAGQVRSAGSNLALLDPSIAPRTLQTSGPNGTAKNYYDSFTIEAEQRIGKNLNILVSGNFYQQNQENWSAEGSRIISRDLSPNLPSGAPNPNFNQLYTEYYRTKNRSGNIVRDMRLSATYDLNLSWMTQRFVVNLQQHQDNPGQKKPRFGEYVDPAHPLFLGTINPALTQAAFNANATTFTNNRFMRRFYLKDGTGPQLTGDLGPVPGLSTYFPDLSNSVGTSNIIDRRFYIPSVGFGASGSYFKGRLHTLVGYRRDHFNMKTLVGNVRPIANTWINELVPSVFTNNPTFLQYVADGTNVGAVFHVTDQFAVAYNRAKSFRISAGDGFPIYTPGLRQGIPTGDGQDVSARFNLFKGKVEFNATYYDNYQPNGRLSPFPDLAVLDEISEIFPTNFNRTGRDFQKISTAGVEVEVVANLTRHWRLILNGATNKVETKDRAPLLKGYQSAAKAMNRPTPLLDAFLPRFPEGVPNPGYTKTRANIFTRYEISTGRLKGVYFGGGMNWREPTFRGNASAVQGGPVVSLWSPSYTTATLLGGYRVKLLDRWTSFALNIDNLFDKEYYQATSVNAGSWGSPRSFRFTMIVDF